MLYFCKAIIKGYSDYIIYEMSARLQTDNMEPAAAWSTAGNLTSGILQVTSSHNLGIITNKACLILLSNEQEKNLSPTLAHPPPLHEP